MRHEVKRGVKYDSYILNIKCTTKYYVVYYVVMNNSIGNDYEQHSGCG